MERPRILVVDDEEDILELVRYNLAAAGFEILCAETGERALEMVRTQNVDLVVLDLMLPGMDGFDVARALKEKEKTREIPIVMLTAKGEEPDVVIGLELGADDYIIKPFSIRILVARVKAVIRRKAEAPLSENKAEIIRYGKMAIDSKQCTLTIDGKLVELTYTEFKILHSMALRPGWVFTRPQIVDAVRGENYPVTDRSVDVQIVGLRRKMGEYGTAIETVRGVGYRFRAPS